MKKTIVLCILFIAFICTGGFFYLSRISIPSKDLENHAEQTLSGSMGEPLKFKEAKTDDGMILAYKNDQTMGYVRYERLISGFYRMVEFQCLPALHEGLSYLTSQCYTSKGKNQVIMRLTVVTLTDDPDAYRALIKWQDQEETYPIEAEGVIYIKRIFAADDIPQTDITITDAAGHPISW